MNYRSLGRTGLRVSELCFGTMTFGGEGMYTAIGSTEQAEADRLVGGCLDVGINFFDTADVYGWAVARGTTEEIIGRWLAQGGRRDSIVLATKVYNMMTRPGVKPEPNRDRRALSAMKSVR